MKMRLFVQVTLYVLYLAVQAETLSKSRRSLPNNPPQVGITWPLGESLFGTGTFIWISAGATDPDGDVAEVRFFVGTNLLAVVNKRPFVAQWMVQGISTGSNATVLSAVATDNQGLSSASSAVTIYYSFSRPPAPVILITSPTNNVFASPATFLFSATAIAAETDGPVPIDFYLGDMLLGRNTKVANPADPHSIVVSNLLEGEYLLRTAYGGQNRDLCTCPEYKVRVTRLSLGKPLTRQDQQVQFEILTAITNAPIIIQVSTNLVAWGDMSTNVATNGVFTVVDRDRSFPRFYRAISQLPTSFSRP
jgi:hypothetical protein